MWSEMSLPQTRKEDYLKMQNSQIVYVLKDYIFENGQVIQQNEQENNELIQASCPYNSFVNDELEEEGGQGEVVPLRNEDSKFAWTHKSTLLFLDEFEKRYEKFRNPKIKKKLLWNEIRLVMESKGYTLDCDTLDRKMRNMKGTYKTIVDNNKKKRTGRGRVQWDYYDRFTQIFANDKTINVEHVASIPPSNMPEAENNNTEPEETVPLANTPSPAPSSDDSGNRPKRLDLFRKRQLEIEEDRLDELKKVRQEIQESNRINREKLDLFKEFIKSCSNK